MHLAETLLFSPEPIAAIQEFFGRGHETWFTAFSMIGETWGVLTAVGLALWIWGRDVAYKVLLAVIVSVLLKELMNLLVTVPRPSADQIVVYKRLETPSFPSGHVLTAVSMWALLAAERRVHWILAVALALLVSLGRLYLGTHYLVDVTVGIVGGLVVAWIVAKSWTSIRRWMERRSFGWAVSAGAAVCIALSLNLAMNSGIPHRWSVTGLAFGLIIGLLCANRVRSEGTPGRGSTPREAREEPVPRKRRIGMVAAGLTGIAGCYALSLIPGAFALWIDMGAMFAAPIWSILAVPYWTNKT